MKQLNLVKENHAIIAAIIIKEQADYFMETLFHSWKCFTLLQVARENFKGFSELLSEVFTLKIFMLFPEFSKFSKKNATCMLTCSK